MENVRSICYFLLVPGTLAWIAFDPIFREKVVEMEPAHHSENFPDLGFDSSHSLQRSTNRFFCVHVSPYKLVGLATDSLTST